MRRCRSPLCLNVLGEGKYRYNSGWYCDDMCKDEAIRYSTVGKNRKHKPLSKLPSLRDTKLVKLIPKTDKVCRWCPKKIKKVKEYTNTFYCSPECKKGFNDMRDKQNECIDNYRFLVGSKLSTVIA